MEAPLTLGFGLKFVGSPRNETEVIFLPTRSGFTVVHILTYYTQAPTSRDGGVDADFGGDEIILGPAINPRQVLQALPDFRAGCEFVFKSLGEAGAQIHV